MPDNKFIEKVFAEVARVPLGKVVTYGQIAALAGKPRNARQVGRLLYGLTDQQDIPWHRVINAQGKISTYRVGTGALQLFLLQQEGVIFKDNGRCKLSDFQWWPESPLVFP